MLFAKLTIAALFCSISLLMQTSCRQDSYRVTLSGPLTISDEWTELHPEPALKADKTFQWVELDLEPPLRSDFYGEGKGPEKKKGILTSDGTVMNPEIEVIDQYGNRFPLVYSGSSGLAPVYGVQYPSKLPTDREYKLVRIRSTQPIKCKSIRWYCESSKDWK
jgi:hypothetical protein